MNFKCKKNLKLIIYHINNMKKSKDIPLSSLYDTISKIIEKSLF